MLDAAKVLGRDEVEGIRVVAPFFVTRPDMPKVKSWSTQLARRYNKEPLYTNAFAYDMAYIISDAAKRVQVKSATNSDWITAIRTTSIERITGPLKFDSDRDLLTKLEVGVYRGGKVLPDNE